MAQFIEDIITNNDLHEQMGKNSLEFVQPHDIHKTLEAFEKLYKYYVAG